MKKWWVLAVICLGIGALSVMSCHRTNIRTAVIDVPQMNSDLDIRIVTNSVLTEVIAQYDGTENCYEIDRSKNLILYHQGPGLRAPDLRRRIEVCIKEVGFEAQIRSIQHNPPPLIQTKDGLFQRWPDRHTAVIYVPDIKSNIDANIVVDAIAYARLGRDDPRVIADREKRQVQATYNIINLAPKSIEQAIACVGFSANITPANLGAEDAIPHGWIPIP